MQKYLQVFANRRIATVLLLGFASGLPLPLVMGTLDGWMASEKVDLKTIGIFSLVGLPYTFKFLWSPFLDRFSLPFLGRRTGWMFVTQVGLIAGILAMGFGDPVNHPAHLALLAVIVAFLSASQDIVIDAYRAEVLEKSEYGAGAAMAVLGARLALLTSGALAFILSDHLPWKTVYALMAACMSLGIIATWMAPTPSGTPLVPKTLQEAVIRPFIDFFKNKAAFGILAFVIFFKLGDAVAGKMTTPFLLQLGFTKTDIGAVNKGFGMISTILGALFAGAWMTRMGIKKALWIFGSLQLLSNFVFVALAFAGHDYVLMVASIAVENLCGGMGTAAFTAFLMSLCNREFTATQYALLTSVMALTRTLSGAMTGYLAEGLGWPWYFTVSAILAVPGLLLLGLFSEPAPAPANSNKG